MSKELEQGMSKKDFAALVNLSVPTIDRLMKKGKLKPYKIGRRVVFTTRHHKEFLEAAKKGELLSEENLS